MATKAENIKKTMGSGPMITRIWHGKTSLENAAMYLDFLLDKGTQEYRQTPGNISVKVWKKEEKDVCHFWTLTEWDNLQAVKAFAGEEYDKAKYYPEDGGVLLEFEEKVAHYPAYDVANSKIKHYVNQLQQLYSGGSWQAESFEGKLKDVDEALAFRKPASGIHSIAEIIWHCIYWRTTLIKRMQGDSNYKASTVEALNFLPLEALQEKGWNHLLNEFAETQQVLIDLISSEQDNFLSEEFTAGDTFEYILEGIIQHDIYHLGQIGLVKKMVEMQ